MGAQEIINYIVTSEKTPVKLYVKEREGLLLCLTDLLAFMVREPQRCLWRWSESKSVVEPRTRKLLSIYDYRERPSRNSGVPSATHEGRKRTY